MAMLTIKSGSEGPSWDPYGYREYIFIRTDGMRVTLHAGLKVYCKAERKKNGRWSTEWLVGGGDAHFDVAAKFFEETTGLTLAQAEKIEQRKSSRCYCGCKKIEEHPGYCGETLFVCSRCGEIVSETEPQLL